MAIRGFSAAGSPTIGDLAERLRLRHHSAVELVDRLVEAGLCVRLHDAADRRRVRLGLTDHAERLLADLSAAHLAELRALRPSLREILDRLDPDSRPVRPLDTPLPRQG